MLRLLTLDDSLFGNAPPLREDEFSSALLGRFFTALWQQREGGGIRLGALDGAFSSDELGHLTGLLQKPESTDHAARQRALRDYVRVIREESEKRRRTEDDRLSAAMRKYGKSADRDGGAV